VTRVVSVRRTGGFAGMVRSGEVDLDGADERVPELSTLVERAAAADVPSEPGRPDAFVYDFDLGGSTRRVPEQHLTDDLRRIAELVLR
jgi:hypothetical protein